MSKLADAAARQLIEERLDLNLLVEAGAGSGKTHSLANRMAAGVVSGKYDVKAMAAVTFTRKAAAEIRGRFQLALEVRLKTARGDERLRIERALASLEHLFAGTIHSFCAHLLRERPVEAGIGPGFTELEETENEEYRQRSWRDYLSRLRAEGSPLVDELHRARVSAKDLDRAFSTVCTFDEVEFPPGDAKEPDVKAALRATEKFWKKLQALMPKPVAPDAKCDTLARIRKFRGLLRAAGSGRGADLVQALRCWEKPPEVTMKWWAERREEKGGRPGKVDATGRRVQERDCRAVPGSLASVPLPPGDDPAFRRARDGARGAAPRSGPELRRPAHRRSRAAPWQSGRAGRAPAEVPLAVRGRVPGHGPHPGGGHVDAGGEEGGEDRASADPDCEVTEPSARGRCSSSATRSSPSTASGGPTSTSTTACARSSSQTAAGS